MIATCRIKASSTTEKQIYTYLQRGENNMAGQKLKTLVFDQEDCTAKEEVAQPCKWQWNDRTESYQEAPRQPAGDRITRMKTKAAVEEPEKVGLSIQEDTITANSRPPLTFEQELRHLINAHSMENHSNTPDSILAEYLCSCLDAFGRATTQRERWYGRRTF